MTRLFQNVSVDLQSINLTEQTMSNVSKSRKSHPENRFTRFGRTDQQQSPMPSRRHENAEFGRGDCGLSREARGGLAARSRVDQNPLAPQEGRRPRVESLEKTFQNGLDICNGQSMNRGITDPDVVHYPTYHSPGETQGLKNNSACILPSSPPLLDLESDSEECHSTHGVRLIMPYTHADAERAQQASIDTWLDEVLDADRSTDANGTKIYERTTRANVGERVLLYADHRMANPCLNHSRLLSPGSSNKENARPIVDYDHLTDSIPLRESIRKPPRRVPLHDAMPEPAWSIENSSPWPSRSPPGSPRPLSAPPKRKKTRSPSAASNSSRRTPPRKDFTIKGDELVSALAQLSPAVQQYRKGRGLRKRRGDCASQLDSDIVNPDLFTSRPHDSGQENVREEPEQFGDIEPRD